MHVDMDLESVRTSGRGCRPFYSREWDEGAEGFRVRTEGDSRQPDSTKWIGSCRPDGRGWGVVQESSGGLQPLEQEPRSSDPGVTDTHHPTTGQESSYRSLLLGSDGRDHGHSKKSS